MRNLPLRPIRVAILILGLAGALAGVAWAHHYRLESASQSAHFVKDGRVDDAIEPSGVAPVGDGRRVLVANEQAVSLQVVDLATGAILGEPLGSAKFPASTAPGPNWGGMARDSEGNYYLIGSHGGKDDVERAASSVVIRFRLRAGEPLAIDDSSVVRWDVARALEAALRSEGLDASRVAQRRVEGLAVREGGGRRQLVIGLSQPDDKVRAYSADITTAPKSGTELKLRPVFAFAPGPREGVVPRLTSLEFVAEMGGFIILTSSVGADNAFRGNTIWYIPNYEKEAAIPYETFEKGMKAGGLAVLGVTSTGDRTEINLLITYDNDPRASGIASRFQTAKLVHERN
jgi:hypothetical protein